MGKAAQELLQDGGALFNGGLAFGEEEVGAFGGGVEGDGGGEALAGGLEVAQGTLDEAKFFVQGGVGGFELDGSFEEFASVGLLVFPEEDQTEGGDDFGVFIPTGNAGGEAAVALLDERFVAVALTHLKLREAEGAVIHGAAPGTEPWGGVQGGG